MNQMEKQENRKVEEETIVCLAKDTKTTEKVYISYLTRCETAYLKNSQTERINRNTLIVYVDRGGGLILAEKDRQGIPVTTVMCKNCSLIRINPRMTQQAYDNYYDTDYYWEPQRTTSEDLFKKRQERGYAYYNYVKEFLSANSKILEVGCATGALLYVFEKNMVCRTVGVDLNNQALEFARKIGLNVIHGHSSQLVSKYKNEFDLVIVAHVMEHFLDIKKEFDIIKLLLKKDALVFIEVPDILAGKDTLRELQLAHTYYFTKETLTSVMSSMGFELVKIDGRSGKNIMAIFRYTGHQLPMIPNEDLSRRVYSILRHRTRWVFLVLIKKYIGKYTGIFYVKRKMTSAYKKIILGKK